MIGLLSDSYASCTYYDRKFYRRELRIEGTTWRFVYPKESSPRKQNMVQNKNKAHGGCHRDFCYAEPLVNLQLVSRLRLPSRPRGHPSREENP